MLRTTRFGSVHDTLTQKRQDWNASKVSYRIEILQRCEQSETTLPLGVGAQRW